MSKYNKDLDSSIQLLRIFRWLFLRLAAFILVVRGISFLGDGRTTKGIVELAIAAAIIAVDILVVGRAIRKMKKQQIDPEFWEKEWNMPLVDKVRRSGRFNICGGIIWTVVCIGLFIIMPIVWSVDHLALCLVLGAVLVSFGLIFFVLGFCEYKKAEAIAAEIEEKQSADDGILYKDYELGYEPAAAQYCIQTGKTMEELTAADEEMIWEYAYAQICYLFAWIAEHDFYQPRERDGSYLEELAAEVKARTKLPSDYVAENDGTLYKDNVKEEARGFIYEYMNNSDYVNGHEVPKQGDIIGAYYPEVEAFAKDYLHAEMFGFPFRWEDYDQFKVHIDEAYEKYQKKTTGSST